MATLDSVKVRDYMTTKLVTFRPDMEVMHAVHTLVEKGISGAPVVDAKGNLVGVLSQRDCLEVALTAAQDTCIAGPVAQYMSEKTADRRSGNQSHAAGDDVLHRPVPPLPGDRERPAGRPDFALRRAAGDQPDVLRACPEINRTCVAGQKAAGRGANRRP
eukprot:TRINITY_DN15455_c0_g1_i1.p1 TRINITY_DN15455_c0_g1~~TRINITY_DN15455_c0_g1_i1.p1  ORF type:complete len:174 (+),score=7.64 TRINITY_DN15455_c0_g1_i1:45-524(+)